MPELPEVETITRQLRPHLEGRVVEGVEILDPRWCAPDDAAGTEEALTGRRLLRLDRRGKHVAWRTDGGTLLLHLRMTGTLLVGADADVPYQRVVLALDDGTVVRFCDPRRFGTGRWFDDDAAATAYLDDRLGPEPLGDAFDGAALHEAVRRRRSPIKALLLDQLVVAGVGNIYADEALFFARIHPQRPGDRLTRAQCTALAEGVRVSLQHGIASGGATIDDFRHVDGVEGWFQNDFQVHRRAGLPCPACGAPVIKRVVAGRGTYSCDRCQPRPRARRTTAPGLRPRRAP
ncbi:bifunctional DNA-formamidopyrimidine glycosylase/DNA-(apurinic or apyrimidinic site) lyase [Patulibacter minatonensis]|uniref:bifunctional DNA-formamidopyrimidine glycosylase/DNA-(apurinic or apyrimidinic site) lyase n=1 Tax=Patulibacter minatonensis TaxID=298163 RepID=UPI00068889A3|nr:bifunctional DNA-formamidopyrimidine glycosylase/DNA-(apurinic or apyrimidinic site) lyase [Patulibacter minatonensis]